MFFKNIYAANLFYSAAHKFFGSTDHINVISPGTEQQK